MSKASMQAMPAARGDLSGWVIGVLHGELDASGPRPSIGQVSLGDEDHALALHLVHELHHHGSTRTATDLRSDADLLLVRGELERGLLGAVRDEVGQDHAEGPVAEELVALVDPDAPSLPSWCLAHADHWHVREHAVHASVHRLKPTNPHAWAIPRLHGDLDTALSRLQTEDYGRGPSANAHAELFALHLERLGIDQTDGAWLDWVPGSTLATTNLLWLFGLDRRWRGALIGHLAASELASGPVMAAHSSALERLGYDAWTRLFFDAHVVVESGRRAPATHELVGLLVEQAPRLRRDVLFGASAHVALDRLVTCKTLAAWTSGRTSLLRELPPPSRPIPGLVRSRSRDDAARTRSTSTAVT